MARFDVMTLEGIALKGKGITLEVELGRALLKRKGLPGPALAAIGVMFVLLGIGVAIWGSEREDRGTTAFLVIALSFYGLLFPLWAWPRRGIRYQIIESHFRAIPPVDWMILTNWKTLAAAGLVAELPVLSAWENFRITALDRNLDELSLSPFLCPSVRPGQMEKLDRMDDARRQAIVETLHGLQEREILSFEDEMATQGIRNDKEIVNFIYKRHNEMVVSHCDITLKEMNDTVTFARVPFRHLRVFNVLHVQLDSPEDARRATEMFRGEPVYWPEPFRVEPAEDLGPLMRLYARAHAEAKDHGSGSRKIRRSRKLK